MNSTTDRCDDPLIDRLFSVISRLGAFRALLDVGDNLTLNQLRILFRLHYRHSMTMSVIATALEISQPTATGIVDRLVRRDLVARTLDIDDRRRVMVALTETGRGLVNAMRCTGADLASRVLTQLTTTEQQALFDALEPLHDQLTKAESQE